MPVSITHEIHDEVPGLLPFLDINDVTEGLEDWKRHEDEDHDDKDEGPPVCPRCGNRHW